MTPGQRLTKLRKQANLQQKELAEALHMNRIIINRIELGKRPMRDDEAVQFARFFRVSTDYILGISDVPLSNEVAVNAERKRYPIIGTVRCGPDGLAYEYIDGFFSTDKEYSGDIRGFLCKGDSMKDDGINDGDMVLVRIQPDVESGELAVVVINGDEGTLKRVRKHNNALILESANSAYPARIFVGDEINDVHIVGKVVELKRFY